MDNSLIFLPVKAFMIGPGSSLLGAEANTKNLIS